MKPKIGIPNPCHEDWEKMKIGVRSRYCISCKKDVTDFRGKSRQEILEYLILNYNKQVCGRFYSSQLDFSYEDFVVTIKALSNQHQNSNLAFYLLTFGALVLSGCENNFKVENKREIIAESSSIAQTSKVLSDSSELKKVNSDPDNGAIKKEVSQQILKTTPKCIERDEVIEVPIEITGIVALPPDTITPNEGPYTHVEQMPEFKGGFELMIAYIQQNLKYPKWERQNKIEGIVYATFVVDKNGKIKDPRILKSVEGSRNFDGEVLRLIHEMPDWEAGSHNGEKVDVVFNLPVNFKLE
ncbi:MAG: energy transducer TonB [Sporocytophaga sp.]|uniref:energy transducer TonB n=1 Tax=Sporocytophaga sp. TaxID=2231183 RepID=UPI001B0B491B|nr:energy transducer TonB [Sporocytophaga sp.]MBO9702094.1 energy transducer TonB [Sporocytophaga sp.]